MTGMPADPQPSQDGPEVDLHALKDDYVDAVLVPDARRARRLIGEATDAGVPVALIYLRVVQPALHDIGKLWQEARIGVANEHLATQITASVMAELAGRFGPGGNSGQGRRAIVSCSPGEMHVLGGQMVSDFLEADGWEVLPLGADTPAEELARLAQDEGVELVALSTALPVHLLAAGTACAALRRLPEPPFIVAGGQAFGGDEHRARAVGADAFAADPETLLRLLGERFGG
jgi:MerR family transcriptional regulator, light-induced transcriptional regulator